MWLLDANMDVHLVSLFAELGIKCETASSRGWGGLTNGDLVSAATDAGFTCILTQDRLFAESAMQAFERAPALALVVIGLPQRPWREYLQQFRAAWGVCPIEPVSGRVMLWPVTEC